RNCDRIGQYRASRGRFAVNCKFLPRYRPPASQPRSRYASAPRFARSHQPGHDHNRSSLASGDCTVAAGGVAARHEIEPVRLSSPRSTRSFKARAKSALIRTVQALEGTMAEQWQSFTSMFTKLAEDLKLPRVDAEQLIEAHRKNIDALARSADVA